MAVIARTGQPLGGDAPPFTALTRLQHMEEAEPHRLLDIGVTLDQHVGRLPELIEVVALLLQQTLESFLRGHRQALPPPDHATPTPSGCSTSRTR